jgi:hypothetical protein
MTVHRIAPNPLKYFGVEYSIETNCVSRRTLDNLIENNLNNLRKGRSLDYVLVGLLPSREAADWFIEQFNITIRPQAQDARNSDDWQNITNLLEALLQTALQEDEKILMFNLTGTPDGK